MRSFVIRESLQPFRRPRVILCDNVTCVAANTLVHFIEKHRIGWSIVLAYEPMSNRKAERMVGTGTNSIEKLLVTTGVIGTK